MLNLGLKSINIQLMCGRVDVPVCTKAVWDMLKTYDGSDKAACIMSGMLQVGVPLDICDKKLLVAVYTESLKHIREQTGLEVPYYPGKTNNDDEVKYTAYTVSDAFIAALSKTKEGREYLNNAYRIKQTEADEDLEL